MAWTHMKSKPPWNKGLKGAQVAWNKDKKLSNKHREALKGKRPNFKPWNYGNHSVETYWNLHRWIETQLGKIKKCDNCQTTTLQRYEWSNMSGKYLYDISDWVRLCSRCHRLIDGAGRYKIIQKELLS